MAEAMKMEEVAVDIGYDMNTDLLIARANQLARLESDALVEKQSSNYNLNRKVVSMMERNTVLLHLILCPFRSRQ